MGGFLECLVVAIGYELLTLSLPTTFLYSHSSIDYVLYKSIQYKYTILY